MSYVKSEKETDFVKIEMEDGGEIVVKLDASVAPITVANFKKLVKRGFYDGLIFHRVIKGFMIQGGDPTGTGMGGSEETIFSKSYCFVAFRTSCSVTPFKMSWSKRCEGWFSSDM